MVIGNGMMAKAFSEFNNNDNVIIFASGVSNSRENRDSEYHKELNLLKNYTNSKAQLIYFSTCSIFDPDLQNSTYILHKKNIEKFISESFSNYAIIRLPNVVGKSENPYTLTNFLFNAISSGANFELYENAFRYFIDVDDVKNTISEKIKSNTLLNGTYNLLFPEPLSVKELVSALENHSGKKANYSLNNKSGCKYKVNVSDRLKDSLNFKTNKVNEYMHVLISKYYS